MWQWNWQKNEVRRIGDRKATLSWRLFRGHDLSCSRLKDFGSCHWKNKSLPLCETNLHLRSFPKLPRLLPLHQATHDAQAGTWIHMPAHLKHLIKAKKPMVMLLVLLK